MTGVTPYDSVPPNQRWSNFYAGLTSGNIDPQGAVRFSLSERDTIASAGSCFAARLAESLQLRTRAYLSAEDAPAWMPPDKAAAWGYGPFSARYGLVYSALQLKQLFERAYGFFVPAETAWSRDGRYVDPFRPRTTPEGYATVAELEEDRAEHFAAVRYVFERANVFVFTLGLTEVWRDRRDCAIYPYCPGLVGGTFDPSVHEFHNAGVNENIAALEAFVAAIRVVNPGIRIILTVSPVPLGTTMEPEHVARATTYSKSVLRVAAQELYAAHEYVDYFASYEAISQSFIGNDPFVGDRRHLSDAVVRSVVDLFFASYFGHTLLPAEGMRGESRVVTQPLPCDEDVFAR